MTTSTACRMSNSGDVTKEEVEDDLLLGDVDGAPVDTEMTAAEEEALLEEEKEEDPALFEAKEEEMGDEEMEEDVKKEEEEEGEESKEQSKTPSPEADEGAEGDDDEEEEETKAKQERRLTRSHKEKKAETPSERDSNSRETTTEPKRKRGRPAGTTKKKTAAASSGSDDDDSRDGPTAPTDSQKMLSDHHNSIKVGGDFQVARMPEVVPLKLALRDEDRDVQLWTPSDSPGRRNDAVSLYCEQAVGKHGIGIDRALFVLYKCDGDLDRAREQLGTRRVISEEWAEDDKILFRQAFHSYGKNFQKIKQSLPHRTMASIINFYYNTKKQHDYKSMFDYRDSEESADEDTLEMGTCENCLESGARLQNVDGSMLCTACRLYQKLRNKPRPVDLRSVEQIDKKRTFALTDPTCREIAAEFESMMQPATEGGEDGGLALDGNWLVIRGNTTQCHKKIGEVRGEIESTRLAIVRTQRRMEKKKAQLGGGIGDAVRNLVLLDRKEEGGGRSGRLPYTWTDEEKMVAFHGLLRYGRDYEAVADVVGTKTPDMVKGFYKECRPHIDEHMSAAAEGRSQLASSLDVEKVLSKLPDPRAVHVECVDLDDD